jgi:hypothetical protein
MAAGELIVHGKRCCTAGPVHSLTVPAGEGMTVHAGS